MSRSATPSDDLSLAEQVCLALIAEESRHGWSLVKELDPSGEVGAIWSLSRALTYRAIDQLETKGLIVRGAAEPGKGPTRVALVATPAGRERAEQWLSSPVRHVRDLRTEFLVKATLLDRRGSSVRPLLDLQEAALAPTLASFGDDTTDVSAVGLWRRESATAAQRFFRRYRAELDGRPATEPEPPTVAAPPTGPRREALASLADSLRHDGVDAVVARTVELRGFGPDRPGELAVVVGADVHGVVLGGAIDEGLRAAAERLLASERAALVVGCSVDDEAAALCGITCGGTAKVLVQRLATLPALFWGDDSGVPRASVTAPDGATITFTQLGERDGTLGSDVDDDVAAELATGQLRWGSGGVTVVEHEGADLVVDVVWSARTLLVVGGGAVTTALRRQATALGWRVVVTTEPTEALAYLDAAAPSDIVVVVSHDPDVDVPVLTAALSSAAGYVGALGSRRTQAARRRRLLDAGLAEADLERLHGPVGLDLGATGPPEIALSIIAEVIAVRTGRTAASLTTTAGPIQDRFRTA